MKTDNSVGSLFLSLLLMLGFALATNGPGNKATAAEEVTQSNEPEAANTSDSDAGATPGGIAAASFDEPTTLVQPIQTLPALVHCGTVVAVEQTTAKVPYRDMKAMLLAHQFDPGSGGGPDTVIDRPPREDQVYAIVTIEVTAQRSLGRHDYVLKDDSGRTIPCLALSWGQEPFDERNWERRTEAVPIEAKLLFEVPPDMTSATLVCDLSTKVPLRQIPLRLRPLGNEDGTSVSTSRADAVGTIATEEPAPAAAKEAAETATEEPVEVASEEEAKPAPKTKEAPKKKAAPKAGDDWF